MAKALPASCRPAISERNLNPPECWVGWFAAAGFNANMVSYLTQELHMPLVESTNTLNNFSGTSSLTPIIGALLADSFAGCFWTITPSSTSWYGYRPEN